MYFHIMLKHQQCKLFTVLCGFVTRCPEKFEQRDKKKKVLSQTSCHYIYLVDREGFYFWHQDSQINRLALLYEVQRVQPIRLLIPANHHIQGIKIMHHCCIIVQLLNLCHSFLSWWANTKHTRSLTVNAHIQALCSSWLGLLIVRSEWYHVFSCLPCWSITPCTTQPGQNIHNAPNYMNIKMFKNK